MGYTYIWTDRGADACEFIELAKKLDPHHATYRLYHAYAQFVLGEYEKVVDFIESVPVNRYSPMSFSFLIVAYIRLGNLEQAKTASELALARHPSMGNQNPHYFLPFARDTDRVKLLDDLSKVF